VPHDCDKARILTAYRTLAAHNLRKRYPLAPVGLVYPAPDLAGSAQIDLSRQKVSLGKGKDDFSRIIAGLKGLAYRGAGNICGRFSRHNKCKICKLRKHIWKNSLEHGRRGNRQGGDVASENGQNPNSSHGIDRRKFVGGAAVTAGVMFIKPELVFGSAANSVVRVGLLGCGGRGTEDAQNLVDTGSARVVALADLFQDQLATARVHFDQTQQAKGYAALNAAQLFVGPDAHQQIAASKEVDAIVIATPPYFHPQHLESVVAGGKHVYLEKPVAVDVPGAMKVIEIGKRFQGKLSLDVGFQIRDCPPFVEMVKRIHNGALGTIVCGEAHYLTGYLDRPPRPNASPVELRLRNWVYDRVLSGDIIVEQNIHVIDICNWILQGHPLKVSASGGRKGRPPGDGDVFGNYHVVFHYPNDVEVTFSSTQFAKGWWDVTERFFGTKGTSQSPYAGPLGIWGDEPWQWSGSGANTADPQAFSATGKFTSNLELADPAKKKAFIESITSGNYHNQAETGAESAISCIMAREAAYRQREVSWDEVLKSREVYDPKINLNKLQ
jgi:myo-inositol 2-dehydrogenase / D-chiro-inositol 1-dehydrogenase